MCRRRHVTCWYVALNLRTTNKHKDCANRSRSLIPQGTILHKKIVAFNEYRADAGTVEFGHSQKGT